MRMRKQWLYFLLCAIFTVALLGCGDDEEEEEAGVPETYSVSGMVTRSTETAGPEQCDVDPELCDARGDVYLTVMDECPASTGCFGEIIAIFDLPGF